LTFDGRWDQKIEPRYAVLLQQSVRSQAGGSTLVSMIATEQAE
jgi:hypothetical protein